MDSLPTRALGSFNWGGGGWGLCQPVVCMLHTAKLGPLELMHAGEMTTQLLLKDTGQILGTRLT